MYKIRTLQQFGILYLDSYESIFDIFQNNLTENVYTHKSFKFYLDNVKGNSSLPANLENFGT